MDRELRWYRSARRHRIGKVHAIHVITRSSRSRSPPPRPRTRLVWIGKDDRGIELEIVALDLDAYVVVIHVTPTELRR